MRGENRSKCRSSTLDGFAVDWDRLQNLSFAAPHISLLPFLPAAL
jgi:hypothetical protein